MAGAVGTIRFRADGQMLLVANLQDRSLTALNVPSLEVIADLPLAMRPQNLCFNADKGQLFVSGEGMDGVAIVFPYDTVEVEQTVLAGRDPGVMTCSADPSYLFVGSHSGSDVCILNVDTRKVIGLVDTGAQPTYITTTPDSQYALILDQKAGDMAVIHIPAIEDKLRSVEAISSYRVHSSLFKQGASLFTMLPVGEKPVHAAVIPQNFLTAQTTNSAPGGLDDRESGDSGCFRAENRSRERTGNPTGPDRAFTLFFRPTSFWSQE